MASVLLAVFFLCRIAGSIQVDPGEQLFLTPYILSGNIEEAQKLSSVESFLKVQDVTSYSGFITVNQTTNASLFFWYFPTEADSRLIIWLQGGPGSSSLFGVFVEHGPYIVNDNGTVSYREVLPWSFYYNVVYIDNPVGTGFSFAGNESDYRVDEEGVADHLFIFLEQFLTLFPDLSKGDIYVAGESMAGKFVPSFGYRLFKEMMAGSSINFKGIMVGNGFSDPETMIPVIGEHLYTLGLLDYNELQEYRTGSDLCLEYIRNKTWTQAYEVFNSLILHGVVFPYPSLYQNSSGCHVYYDFVNMCNYEPSGFTNFPDFVRKSETRKKLHVGHQPYHTHSSTVKRHLVDDVPQTVRPLIEAMLNSTRVKVLFYSGMNDIVFPTPATDALMRRLSWYGGKAYQNAPKIIWKRKQGDDVFINGYVTQAANLTFVALRGGSHAVPYDLPLESFDMIFRFIENESFSA